jgi:hypothetical protein
LSSLSGKIVVTQLPPPEPQTSHIGPIVGGIGGVVVQSVLVIILVFFIRLNCRVVNICTHKFSSSQNNVKTKVLLSQAYVTLVDFYYHVPFGFLVPNKFQISWLSNILALSVPEEGYRRHTSSGLNLISTFLFMHPR